MAVVLPETVVWGLVVERLGGNFKESKDGNSLLGGKHSYRPRLQGHLLEIRGPYGHGKALVRIKNFCHKISFSSTVATNHEGQDYY